MARREVTQFYDDLDHSLIPEDQLEVVRFSVNGQNYLIDLSLDNARRFHDVLAPLRGCRPHRPRYRCTARKSQPDPRMGTHPRAARGAPRQNPARRYRSL